MFDGDILYCFDGRDSAVANIVSNRSSYSLAFDPRTIGITTGLFNDLTLHENIAYHSGSNFSVSELDSRDKSKLMKRVSLRDRFGQAIKFDVEAVAPYRVHRYSKTIPAHSGDGFYCEYIAESDFRGSNDGEWLPRRVLMYTLYTDVDNSKSDEVVLTLEPPQRPVHFAEDTWTLKGLGLPFGQALVDLRIKERVGYWDGQKLTQDPPIPGVQPLSAKLPAGRFSIANVIIWGNVLFLASICIAVVIRCIRKMSH